jgi:rare lipoprotein A (RlpA)-like double-psi beta-barrel protein
VPDPGGGTQVLHAGLVTTYPGARPFTRRLPLLCTVVVAVLVIVFATYSDLAAAPPSGGGWAYLGADSGPLGASIALGDPTSDAAKAMAAGGQARRPTEAILAVAVPPPVVTDRPLSAPLGVGDPQPQIPRIARPPSGNAVSGRVARPVAPTRLAAVDAAVTTSGGGWHTAYVSWYGPGFYGNRTACGLAYTRGIVGVAHRTLPCGTRVTFRNGSRVVTTRVIDRGPYVAGRNWDLSAGLCTALAHCYTGNIQWRFP